MIIDKKHKARIKALSELNDKNYETENAEFVAICEVLEIDPEGDDGNALFDHIFNKTMWTVKFK